jgi:hypothetical protein
MPGRRRDRRGRDQISKPRLIDPDADTVTVLRAWRKERGSMALQLLRNDALVFGDVEGQQGGALKVNYKPLTCENAVSEGGLELNVPGRHLRAPDSI